MFIQLRDFKMAYDDQGSGIPLLFIHGYPLSRRIWQEQLTGLSDYARVLTIDLRGHGESQPLPAPYSMDMLADDVADFLDALKITRPVVLGCLSMGGYITMALVRRHPDRLAGLVLTATRAGADLPEAKANRDKSAAAVRAQGISAAVESMLPKMMAPETYERKPEVVARLKEIMAGTSVEGVVGDLMGLRDRPDSMPTLKQVQMPTLIVHGARDQIVPLQEAQAMQAAVRGSRLEVFSESGHLPPMEQPGLYNQTVLSFLEENF